MNYEVVEIRENGRTLLAYRIPRGQGFVYLDKALIDLARDRNRAIRDNLNAR
jgi:hypothetical protein